jgi:hypothetical protein
MTRSSAGGGQALNGGHGGPAAPGSLIGCGQCGAALYDAPETSEWPPRISTRLAA